jgi:hypothetical protein
MPSTKPSYAIVITDPRTSPHHCLRHRHAAALNPARWQQQKQQQQFTKSLQMHTPTSSKKICTADGWQTTCWQSKR